ncbi:class I SAM-dependent methyltransferase [Solimonas sp. K1W22B-7]|uniref:class I SAM-dependent methyltransferase n=1 Tax=Solimonas sp. K1W22B-7 TaxID=2303331 RepID=UPI0019698013|nr:methyltransferase domain-containing protein [Solimonas sp. K1W22B-7]
MKDHDHQLRLQDSWTRNAGGWIEAVREGRIESRRLVTDAAILAAIRARQPARLLDIGCGEGWLCRTLAQEGVEAVGVDASAPLVDAARAAGGGRYELMDYEDLGKDAVATLGRFDLLVCNFALLDDRLVPLLLRLHELRKADGRLLIQTLHPGTEPGEGWREERFEGFGSGFPATMPWYFRSMEAWREALRAGGWGDIVISEPRHPRSGAAASLLIDAAALESTA